MNAIDALRMRYPAMQTPDIPMSTNPVANATLPGATLADRLRLGQMGYDEIGALDFDTMRQMRYAEQQQAQGKNPTVTTPGFPTPITGGGMRNRYGATGQNPAANVLAQRNAGMAGKQWGQQAAGGAASALAGRMGRSASLA